MLARRCSRSLVSLAAGATLLAASQRAGLYGRILDSSEGAVAEAAVTVISEDTGFRRLAQSDLAGNYAVSPLDPGIYKVTVRKEGFRTVMQFGVRLSADAATRADFVLPVGSIEETITVESAEPAWSGPTPPPAGASSTTRSNACR